MPRKVRKVRLNGRGTGFIEDALAPNTRGQIGDGTHKRRAEKPGPVDNLRRHRGELLAVGGNLREAAPPAQKQARRIRSAIPVVALPLTSAAGGAMIDTPIVRVAFAWARLSNSRKTRGHAAALIDCPFTGSNGSIEILFMENI